MSYIAAVKREPCKRGDGGSLNSADYWLQRGHAQDVGGQATRQRDEAAGAKKAKEEFPESPTQIGMQDERGGKAR